MKPQTLFAACSARDWRRIAAWTWSIAFTAIAVRVIVQGAENHSVYIVYLNSARRWIAGHDLYTVDNLKFRYSPLFTAFFTPFSLLPERAGAILWRLLNVAVFAAGLCWWKRSVLPLRDDAPSPIMFLLALPLTVLSLNNGQANPLMTGLMLCAFAAVADERWNAAALCLASAIFLKLYPLAAALLLALLHPRKLPWRQLVILALGVAASLFLQKPAFVAKQFADWLTYLRNDLRLELPAEAAYRDLRLLLDISGLHLHPWFYFALQLLGALAVALICVLLKFRGVEKRTQLTLGYSLVACWILLLGPATESCTYVLAAPFLAWLLVDDWLHPHPTLFRAALFTAASLLVAELVANWFPFAAKADALGLHPLAMLCVLGCLSYEIKFALRGRPMTAPLAAAVS